MSFAKVLFVVPNPRTMSLVSPIVSHFYNILKTSDIDLLFFDTTFYDISDHFFNPDEAMIKTGSIKDYSKNIDSGHVRYSGHQNLLDNFRKTIIDYSPDVIFVSAMESTFSLAIGLLAHVRELGIFHVLGGVFATCSPQKSLKYSEIDAICVGEGEGVIVDLVRCIKKSESLREIPNIWYKEKDGSIVKKEMVSPISLGTIPRFSKEPYHDSRFYRSMGGKIFKMFPVETHRGCTQQCRFCNAPLLNEIYKDKADSRYFRSRPIRMVMEDIEYFVKECSAQYLFFWADNFYLYTRAEIDEFCERFADFKIPFYVQSYPTTLDEYKTKKLVSVGLDRVGMGIEHGNEQFRAKIIGRNYSNEAVIEAARSLRDFGVTFSCNNIVGFPYETPELHWDTVMLNRGLGADSYACSIFTPFQGTDLRRIALEEGFLKDDNQLAPSNFDKSILNMPQFPPEQVSIKAKVFNLYVKAPESRFEEIKKAEENTFEGKKKLNDLIKEFQE